MAKISKRMKEDHKGTLRDIPNIQPVYILPNDPFAKDVLIPCFNSATSVDCMMSFFSSEILVSIASGLATFINSSDESLRLIISPLLRDEDRIAIEEGINSPEDIVTKFFKDIVITEDYIAQHTLKCLSWLLHKKRVEIKIALMKNALFHPKVWLFRDDVIVIAAHGSSNMTNAGIQKNIEQITVSKSWEGDYQQSITKKFCELFNQLWTDNNEICTVIPIPKAIETDLLKTYNSDNPPTESDLQTLYEKTTNTIEELQVPYSIDNIPNPSFTIPSYLNYETGDFDHQGKAVKAWCDSGYQGVLEMATGSGKTITSMICLHKLYEKEKPILAVVAAPYVPLIIQWCDEILPFGLTPVNLTNLSGPTKRTREINRIRRRIQNGKSEIEIVVTSHRTLCSADFKVELEKFGCKLLLIADEVHNLGSEGFISTPPSFFDYRLGLSATPIRQYDQEGTEELFSFFGPIVFKYSLKEAIGKCLVEYEYYVHPIELTDDEMEKWYEITDKIKKNSWRQENGDPDEYLNKLFRDRRSVLENAKNKINELERILSVTKYSDSKYTLIYTTDKAPQQLDQVNALLKAQGILFHQLTYEETGNTAQMNKIIKSYKEGTIAILTAKRVLDEGVNIPQIQKAYILASTTVERQWTQRRGRLLRKCTETGKTQSEIHDFIALPPDLENIDSEAHSLIRSELLRVQEFASLAMNAGRLDGPLNLIDQLVKTIYL